MKKNKKDLGKITIKGGYVPIVLENAHDYFSEVKRGTGVQKSKKGKGSYNRKQKHKEVSHLNKR